VPIDNLKKYGTPPFSTVLVHGGPGAAGEMAPVARRLAYSGIAALEPLQTESTLRRQLDELKDSIISNAECPVYLIGFSWGAWLSFILAAENPSLVKKLILIGSGVFEEKYVKNLHETRLARLSADEKKELEVILDILKGPEDSDKDAAFQRFGALLSKTDSFSPCEDGEKNEIDFSPDIFNGVWPEAAAMRKNGMLMKLCSKIKCPVTAIHGDHDPSLADGVQKPLAASLREFKFVLLDSCGHKPWIERYAREQFYEILQSELEVF